MTCKIPQDLTLDEALADPVIRAALRADHVDPRHFEVLLRTTARRLDDGGPTARRLAAVTARPCCGARGDLTTW